MKYSTKIFFLTLVVFKFIIHTNLYSQLNGNYIIGSGGNYPSIKAAVIDLVNNGVNAPVIFNIKPGYFYESVTIDSVKGVNSANTVTFRSQSGSASDVVWFANTYADNSFNLRIKRADYLTFRDITFSGDSIGNNSRRLIELLDHSTNISFLFNVLQTNKTLVPSTILIYSDASDIVNLRISGNTFLVSGGLTYNINHEGILLDKGHSSLKTQITGNTFTNLTSSITVKNSDSLLIEKNIINMGNTSNSNFGVNLSNCNGMLRVLKNRINSEYNCDFQGYSLFINNSENSLIANNFILFKGGSIAILSIFNLNQRYKNNTIASLGGDCANNMYILSSNSITLQNNIYVNFDTNPSPGGVPYYIFNSSINSEHNNFYYESPFIAQYNSQDIRNLKEWREVSGLDFESNEKSVDFVSDTDLHLDDSSINDFNLKGAPDAEVSDDIDGNPRDPYYPAMGADEPYYPLNIYVILTLYIEGLYEPVMNFQQADTVRAYLRNATAPYSVIDSCKASLQQGGKSAIRFFNAPTGNYYLTVKHRNSLETWSKAGGESLITGGFTTYDFTNSITKAFGNNLVSKGNSFCIYSGDVDQKGEIDLTDVLEVYNNSFSFSSGYQISDLNGDEEVDLTDVLIVYNNSTKFIGVRRP